MLLFIFDFDRRFRIVTIQNSWNRGFSKIAFCSNSWKYVVSMKLEWIETNSAHTFWHVWTDLYRNAPYWKLVNIIFLRRVDNDFFSYSPFWMQWWILDFNYICDIICSFLYMDTIVTFSFFFAANYMWKEKFLELTSYLNYFRIFGEFIFMAADF